MRTKQVCYAAILAGFLFSGWTAFGTTSGEAPRGSPSLADRVPVRARAGFAEPSVATSKARAKEGEKQAPVDSAEKHGTNFLGSYDFIEGKGEGLEVSFAPDVFKVEKYDGHTLLRIERAETVPVNIVAGQDKPEFPLVIREKAGKAEEIALRLKILDKEKKGIDPKQGEDIFVVLKLYDVGYLGSYGGNNFKIRGHGGQEELGTTSGSHWSREPLDRVRILEKTYLLTINYWGGKMFLDGYYKGSDIEIVVNNYLYLQGVELYRKDNALYNRHENMLMRITQKQFELIKNRSLIEDRSFQAERMSNYLEGFGGSRLRVQSLKRIREEILSSFLDLEVAVDDFYYKGRVAVARVNPEALAELEKTVWQRIEQIEKSLNRLEKEVEVITSDAYRAMRNIEQLSWFTPVCSTLSRAPYHGNKVNPYERIMFIGFDLWGLQKSFFTRSYKPLGISADFEAYSQGGLLEDNTFERSRRRDEVYDRKIFDEMPVMALTSRHFFIPVGGEHQYGGLPKWFVDKYEKTEDIWAWNGAGEVKGKVNGFNDRVLDYFRQYHKRIAEDYRNTPEFFAVQIAGEGQQYLSSKGGCENGYSPSAKRKFRAYLKEKYGSIEAMNKTLGTACSSFDAVEPPPDMGIQLRRKAGPLDYDFERFRRTGLVNMIAEGTKAIKEINPELLVWWEASGRFDMTVPHGIDTYNTFKIVDMASTHASGRFNPIWNMSVHRYGKGVYGKEENIPDAPVAHCNPKIEWLRAAQLEGYMMELLCGNRCLGAWHCGATVCRGMEIYGAFLYDKREDIQPMRSAGSIAVIRKRADMWLPILNTARWRHPRIGMLYSTTTQMVGWPYQEMEQEAFAIHNWLYYNSGINYLVAHEDALCDTSENLNHYQVIIAPFATHTRHELDDAYIRWINNGGTLISSGPFGVYNQYGQKDLKLLKEVFGDLDIEYLADEIQQGNKLSPESIAYLRNEAGDLITTAVSGWFWKITLKEKKPDTRVLLALEDGTPVLLEGKLGAGRVFFSACGLGQNGLAKLTLMEVRRRVRPFARVREDFGFMVVPLVDAARRTCLGVMNLNYERPLKDTIIIDAKVNRVVDLGIDQGSPVPVRYKGLETEIELELAPGDGTILDLGLEADMVYAVRAAGEDLPMEDKPAMPPASFDNALRKIEGSNLAPEAKREAFALISIGKKFFSRGAYHRAERYLDQGLTARNPPDFVKIEGDEIFAKRADKAVKLDGVLDEWAGAKAVPLKGSAVSGGMFKVMWDTDNIYVAVVVRDTDIKESGEQGTGVNWRWGFDGAVIRLNASDACGMTPSGFSGEPLPDGYQVINMAVGGRKYGYPITGVSPANVRFAVKRIEGGYVMEAAIPAHEYLILPAAGASVGFDLQLEGAVGAFCRYSKREGMMEDGLRLGRLYFCP